VRDETADVCPACGQPILPEDDYVTAREHASKAEFALHSHAERSSERLERRFHVGHFRGRLGDHFYELVTGSDDHSPQ
jgi:hypothetical protein